MPPGVFTKEGPRASSGMNETDSRFPLSSNLADVLRLRLAADFLETRVLGEREQPSRGTRESHFAEAWVRGVSEGGIRLRKHERFCREMRERSPHVGGMQIDAIVKSLQQGPGGSMIGTPYDEEMKSWFRRFMDAVRGKED